MALALSLVGCDGAEPSSAPDQVTGVIVEIESVSLEDVESFTLRSEGDVYEILIDPEIEYGFPLSHLNVHRTSAEPVVVELDERDGELYALSIEDA